MNRTFNLNPEELSIVDGKVVISSEDLAAAIQSQELDLSANDAEDSIDSNIICITIGGDR